MKSMSRKLNQILAIEKGVKKRTADTITELHRVSANGAVFSGITKTYEVLKEGNLPQPPQSMKVQRIAEEMFDEAKKALTELFDVTATKDWGNQLAKADLVVDGQAILKGVPATYLLFLDKQLSDLRDLIGKCATLDESVDWSADPNSGLFRSAPVKSHTTNKVQEPIVVVPATEHHPAQVQVMTRDVVVGEWTTVRHSGALPLPRKKLLLERVQKLLDAVKVALEAANMTEVENQRVGANVLDYIFSR